MKKHLLFSRVNHDGRTTVERRSNDGQSQGRYSVGLVKLLFTITLLLTLGVGQMWGYNKFPNGQYIYYDYGSNTNWTSATYDPKFGIYWDSGEWNTEDWGTSFTDDDKTYYYIVIPNAYTSFIQLMRMNPNNHGVQWCYADKKEAPASSSNNLFYFTENKCDAPSSAWGTYAPPLSDVSLSDNGTAILAGGGTELNPYLIATSATIQVVSSGTKAVADPDATIWYDIKDNTTSKQNSSNAACSFTASATANTVYQMKVDGYTKVSSTSSTKLTSDIIYYKTVSVKNISVYIYVGDCTSDQINSLVLTGTPYVGSVALTGVTKYTKDFTTDGNWLKYTFTNVSKVASLGVAGLAGAQPLEVIANATEDTYYRMFDGTVLDSKCVPRSNPTWGTAPTNGAAPAFIGQCS